MLLRVAVLIICVTLVLPTLTTSLSSSPSAMRARTFKAVVDALKSRNKTVTTLESTTGGLISSSIMEIDGASSCYFGGSVAYNTRRCKPILLNDEALHDSLVHPTLQAVDGESEGDHYKRSKLDWTRKTAIQYCQQMGTDFAVAEGGAAGPSFRPKGLTTGFSAIAVAARNEHGAVDILHSAIVDSSHADRVKNMELFASTAGRELLKAITRNDGLDRRVELRTDADALAELAKSGDARFVVIAGPKMLFRSDTELALLPLAEAQQFSEKPVDSTTGAFLGFAKGLPIFAFEASTSAADDEGFADTRTQAPFLDFTENQVALCATGIMTWHRNSKFCPKCGSATKITQGGHCSVCINDDCGAASFPRNDPAVIVAVSSRDNSKILLARSPRHPEKMFTTLAGFVECGETFEDAVKREVLEESGVDVDEVRYIKVRTSGEERKTSATTPHK